MTSINLSDEVVTPEEILALIASMNNKQLSLWYDIGRTIQARLASATPNQNVDDDWLNDTEEQIAAEDKLWDATTAQFADKLEKIAAHINANIRLGHTQAMFDTDGKFIEP